MPTLVIASTRVDTPPDGTDLRTRPLCELIPGERHLLVVPLYPLPAISSATGSRSGVFDSVTECPPLLDGPRSVRRHLRLRDDHYLETSRRQQFRAARRTLTDLMRQHGIDKIAVFGSEVAELVTDLDGCRKVLDLCDSMTLRLSRAMRHGGWNHGRSFGDAVDLCRVRRTESRLPELFDQVVTVSAVDTAEIKRLSGGRTNVFTVPNGVDESFLAPLPRPADRRAVVFWGNLDFEPNIAALQYFFDEVWSPRLRSEGIAVLVVGRNAPPWLKSMAEHEPLIRLSGFVSDLRAAVTPYPVMINPMQTGSGIKNKVLEAFGMGIVVVSTARGVEAMPDVVDGEHLVIADGDAFGAAVTDLLDDPDRRLRLRANANALLHARYPWSVAAAGWRELFYGWSDRSRCPGPGSLEAAT